MKRKLVFFLSSVLGLAACTGDDKKAEPLISDLIYREYKIRGEEGKEALTIRMQFRRGGKNGTTLVLNSPAKVELDGEALQADSVGKIGSFYEVQKRLDEFTGEHSITLLDEKGILHQQPFEFIPFSITELPPTLSREDLNFELDGLEDGESIHIILTDTSFSSNDINEIDTVRNGKLELPKEKLSTLVNGPISLQFIRNKKELFREGGKRTGHITITYSLRREFLLEN